MKTHQPLMNSRVGLLQQQLTFARENINNEREHVELFQGQVNIFSPVCMGGGFTPAPMQRTHG
eukprot:9441265-Prorocentrum_lima.AAC.1